MLLGAKQSANHISPEGQMSLLGLPIPVPGLYAKNNLNDGLRHRAASTVCDREPGRTIKGAKTDGRTRCRGSFASYEIPAYLAA